MREEVAQHKLKYCECCELEQIGELSGYDDWTPVYNYEECGQRLDY